MENHPSNRASPNDRSGEATVIALRKGQGPGRLDRHIVYFEPHATSHDTLDKDENMQEESRNVACAVAKAVADLRAGRLQVVPRKLSRPPLK